MHKTVLVVDDDPGVRELVSLALEDEGYRVAAAVGEEAVRTARQRQPDLILLDLMMPGMDGVEVSKRLRADPRTAAIPIVAMSTREAIHAAAPTLPVNARLCKPFELTDLYCTLAQWTDGP